jgi:hypothetical protein
MQSATALPSASWLNLSFAQSSSANWSQNGQDFASLGLSWISRNAWSVGRFQLRTSLDSKLGATYLSDSSTTETFRVTDNDLFAEGLVAYSLGWQANPYLSAGVRTSLTEAFAYGARSRTRTGRFWDPVMSQQALGWTFTRADSSSMVMTRLGVTLQQVRARYHTRMSDDPKTPDEQEAYSAQSGIEWVSDALLRLDTNIGYNGRLSLTSTFEQPGIWTVRSENILQFRIWKFIGATLAISIVHDIRQTRKTQFKQSLMLGLAQEF